MSRGLNIELFCCAGGMAEGFRRAGIEFDLAFDADPNACESYKANLGHRPIQMDCRDLLRMLDAGWRPGSVQLLVADPPCTPWSRAGKRRGLEDDRDMLQETVRLIALLSPHVWLIGNVPGLDDSNNWGTVQEIIGDLYHFGYCIDYTKLDAANYGVPQRRIRPFWFGHSAYTPHIQWPKPTHGDPATLGASGLGEDRKPWVTCREALGHLSIEELGTPRRLRLRYDRDGSHPPSRPDRPAQTVEASTPRADKGGAVLLTNSKHSINKPDEPSYTVTSAQRGAQGSCAAEWPWDRPATTVYADQRLAPPGHHEKSFLSPKDLDRPATTVMARGEISQPGRNGRRGTPQSANAIVLSEKAATILQGFPETWVFSGNTKKARWGQLGQAMPPPLAQAVASSIVQGGYLEERGAAA